ncbi:MAG TPA: DMT family transporter [Methanocorpusculum sp.]|nr:DMT family transporter [Methanocorpusculum sp.]
MAFFKKPANTYTVAVLCVIAAAVFDAFETPLTKLFLSEVTATVPTFFLSIGGGIVVLLMALFGRKTSLMEKDRHLRKKDIPYLIGVVLGNFGGMILIFYGLTLTSAATGSVLKNFMTVAIALVALIVFKEKVTKRLWTGIVFITLGCVALSFGTAQDFTLTPASILILLGCICFGFADNFNTQLAHRNPTEIVIVKSFGVSFCALIVMLITGEGFPAFDTMGYLMLIGVFSSGLYLLFFTYGQRHLGAAKSGAIFGINPLLSILLSFLIFQDNPSYSFFAALVLVIPGMYFAITRNKEEETDDDEYINTNSAEPVFLSGLSEALKTEVRNYVTSFGFILMATVYVLILFGINDMFHGVLSMDAAYASMTVPAVIIGLLLLLCGVVLLGLRKRVLSAVTFIFSSAGYFIYAFEGTSYFLTPLISIFSIVIAFIFMTSTSPKKYVYALIHVLWGIVGFLGLFNIMGLTPVVAVTVVLMIVTASMLIYFAVACAAQKIHLPLTKFLTTDDDMEFSRTGPVLGYLFMGAYIFIWVVYNFTGEELLSSQVTYAMCFILSLMLMLIGILAFSIGRMRFTPLLFLGAGTAFLLDLFVNGSMHYVVALLLLIIGIFAVFRKNSRLLPSLLLIGFGFSRFLMNSVDTSPDLIYVVSLINIACLLLALYLAFGVFAEKPKLPMF